MKFKPIVTPSFNGCLNCSPIPYETMSLDHEVEIDCIDCLQTYFGGHKYHHYFTKLGKRKLQDIIDEFKAEIVLCDSFCIELSSALHGEIYEFNKEDGLFYLVEQTMGYA